MMNLINELGMKTEGTCGIKKNEWNVYGNNSKVNKLFKTLTTILNKHCKLITTNQEESKPPVSKKSKIQKIAGEKKKPKSSKPQGKRSI
jgi:hypothetical protein